MSAGAVEIAGAEGHVLHGIDHRDGVVLGDVDMLDGSAEKFLLV